MRASRRAGVIPPHYNKKESVMYLAYFINLKTGKLLEIYEPEQAPTDPVWKSISAIDYDCLCLLTLATYKKEFAK